MKKGRWLIWLSTAIILVLALVMAPDTKSLAMLGHELVPIFNFAFIYCLLPLIIIIGLIRKKV